MSESNSRSRSYSPDYDAFRIRRPAPSAAEDPPQFTASFAGRRESTERERQIAGLILWEISGPPGENNNTCFYSQSGGEQEWECHKYVNGRHRGMKITARYINPGHRTQLDHYDFSVSLMVDETGETHDLFFRAQKDRLSAFYEYEENSARAVGEVAADDIWAYLNQDYSEDAESSPQRAVQPLPTPFRLFSSTDVNHAKRLIMQMVHKMYPEVSQLWTLRATNNDTLYLPDVAQETGPRITAGMLKNLYEHLDETIDDCNGCGVKLVIEGSISSMITTEFRIARIALVQPGDDQQFGFHMRRIINDGTGQDFSTRAVSYDNSDLFYAFLLSNGTVNRVSFFDSSQIGGIYSYLSGGGEGRILIRVGVRNDGIESDEERNRQGTPTLELELESGEDEPNRETTLEEQIMIDEAEIELDSDSDSDLDEDEDFYAGQYDVEEDPNFGNETDPQQFVKLEYKQKDPGQKCTKQLCMKQNTDEYGNVLDVVTGDVIDDLRVDSNGWCFNASTLRRVFQDKPHKSPVSRDDINVFRVTEDCEQVLDPEPGMNDDVGYMDLAKLVL